MKKVILPVLLVITTGVAAQTDTTIRKLKEFSVTSRKKTIEVKDDKIIYNVSTSVNAIGSNGLDLLRRSPGVIVDPANNISLNGKAGVTVYIDGKPTYMQGDALVALLKSLQSANIQSIEIMPNPSGKYDAAGSGGIINIRLKKLTAAGYNGDVAAGLHFGETPKTEAALNMNYRTGKFNLYGNYNHHIGYNNMQYDFYRIQEGQIYDNRTKDTDKRNPVNFKAGVDYTINKHSTIGLMMNANLYIGPGVTYTTTYISDSATGKLQSMLNAYNDYYSQQQNWKNYNLNYQYKDSIGRTFTTDIDYGAYRARIKNILYNQFLAADSTTETDSYTLRTLNNSDINMYGLKADYEQPWASGKLYGGVKANAVHSDNQVSIYNVDGHTETLNIQRSNSFLYEEAVYAAYLMADQELGKWKLSASLRGEQTSTDGRLVAKSKVSGQDSTTNISNHYFDLFPAVQLSYRYTDAHRFSLFYNRKIDRPNYADLNPFEYQMDELSYWKGNSFLRPQYVNSVSLGYNAAGIISATLAYTHTKDVSVQISDSIGNKLVITPENIGSQNLISLNISSSFAPWKWWNITANANIFYKENSINFDPERITKLSLNTVNFNLQQVFDLDAKSQLELSGFYNSPGLSGGFRRTGNVWQMNIGLQRKVLHDKGTVRIGISDVFQTFRWYSIRVFDGMYYRSNGYQDSRQLKLGFSYRFGNLKIGARERNSGLENESRRVK
ncbi:outer membrane beta-barrel family protein [Chitinophaga sp. Cy-1792]|uniref:outer membrane beta-barrel family protein n=1 Tax=Chitinophaga sp. Cy-1792 TaxID=2608339 RepID=UPI00141EA814|nr:outer membrane beta-barrel family protein [Chitinophaga sp. Cy-1792]NIG56944.1 TonB-dependent receptor [Chitinophaga sp. Cy-1792]